jgi:SNF2 family DNA or RNA helicase
MKIKSLPDRKFNMEGKYWTIPATLYGTKTLIDWGFILDTNLQQFYDKKTAPIKSVEVIPGLKGILFPFQKDGVSFIESHAGRALIADEMGLGKTVQALAWLQLHPELRPAVIVAPASLKFNWKKEAENWLSDPNIEILSGKKSYKTTGKILIINYDILGEWVENLKKIKPQTLIMDEVHYIKSNKTIRTQAAKELAKGIPHLITLSGTPIMNRPIEMYNAINLIDNTLFPNAWVYAKRYCGAYNNGYGWDFNGASNTEELHQKLINTCMIRRKKIDVLKDLPEKITSFVPISINNELEYKSAENNFIQYVRETKGNDAAVKASNAEMLTQINLLKQLCIKGKLNGTIEWIENFLESGQKLVVFVTHIDTVNQLMEHFKTAVRFDGTVSLTDRDKAVTDFQENPNVNLFLGMLDSQGKPSGVGITLTAAYATATIEYQWSPGVHDQADDRIHRIGQKNSCINYKLIALNTIEEKIALMLDKKRKVLDSILDGVETESESLLTELINNYLKA